MWDNPFVYLVWMWAFSAFGGGFGGFGGAGANGALTRAASTTALTDITSLSFSTIIQVKPSCCAIDNNVNLTLINTDVPATFSNVNVVITKLC